MSRFAIFVKLQKNFSWFFKKARYELFYSVVSCFSDWYGLLLYGKRGCQSCDSPRGDMWVLMLKGRFYKRQTYWKGNQCTMRYSFSRKLEYVHSIYFADGRVGNMSTLIFSFFRKRFCSKSQQLLTTISTLIPKSLSTIQQFFYLIKICTNKKPSKNSSHYFCITPHCRIGFSEETQQPWTISDPVTKS